MIYPFRPLKKKTTKLFQRKRKSKDQEKDQSIIGENQKSKKSNIDENLKTPKFVIKTGKSKKQ